MKKVIKKPATKRIKVALYSKGECNKEYCGVCMKDCQV